VNLTIVTSNAHKAQEVGAFFGGSLKLSQVSLDIPELRSENIEEIAYAKAQSAFEELKRPLIVDDTGFFIDAFNGFPGPYAAYVLRTVGVNGILKLMEGVTDRNASFVTSIGYADEREVRVFSGTIQGTIATEKRGAAGFGYDPIFLMGNRTLAEMALEEKSRVSHRARALSAFRDWFLVTHLK